MDLVVAVQSLAAKWRSTQADICALESRIIALAANMDAVIETSEKAERDVYNKLGAIKV